MKTIKRLRMSQTSDQISIIIILSFNISNIASTYNIIPIVQHQQNTPAANSQSEPQKIPPSIHHDYIVLGAGIAGLQAASILAENKQDFVVLEAQDKIGGRISCLEMKQAVDEWEKIYEQKVPSWMNRDPSDQLMKARVEMGATWICQEHHYMKRLVKENGIQLFRQYVDGKIYYAAGPNNFIALKKMSDEYDKSKDTILSLIKRIKYLRFTLNELEQSNAADSKKQLKEFLDTYSEMKVTDFLRLELQDEQLVQRTANDMGTLECIHCDEISVTQLLRDDSSLDNVYYYCGFLKDNIDGFRIDGAMLSVCESLKKSIERNCILTNRPPTDVIKFGSCATKISNLIGGPVAVTLSNGQVYTCRRLMATVPIAVVHKIKIEPISPMKELLFSNQIPGQITRYYCVYEKAFWRDRFCGYVNFSYKFFPHELTDLSPSHLKYGMLAFIFTHNRYAQWQHSIMSAYDPSSQKAHNDGVDGLIREGQGKCPVEGRPTPYPHTRQSRIYLRNRQFKQVNELFKQLFRPCDQTQLENSIHFNRTLCENPFIIAAYQAAIRSKVQREMFEKGESLNDVLMRDENNIVWISTENAKQYASYMEGAVRIAREKVYKELGLEDPWFKDMEKLDAEQ